MKARDIIPGWPRGRSTADTLRWKWAYGKINFFCSEERDAEQTVDCIYHDQQQRAVDKYRANLNQSKSEM